MGKIGEKIVGLFMPSGDTIKGVAEGLGTAAKDLRESITGEGHELSMEELKVHSLEMSDKVLMGLQSISAIEAQGNWFQRSWRPGLAWCIIGVIFVQYLLYPVLSWAWVWAEKGTIPAPQIDAADLWPIILGLIGYRTIEKTNKLGK